MQFFYKLKRCTWMCLRNLSYLNLIKIKYWFNWWPRILLTAQVFKLHIYTLVFVEGKLHIYTHKMACLNLAYLDVFEKLINLADLNLIKIKYCFSWRPRILLMGQVFNISRWIQRKYCFDKQWRKNMAGDKKLCVYLSCVSFYFPCFYFADRIFLFCYEINC